MAAGMMYKQLNDVDATCRLVSSPAAHRRLVHSKSDNSTAQSRDDKSSSVHQRSSRSDQMTCYPLRHMHTSFASLFRRADRPNSCSDVTDHQKSHISLERSSRFFSPRISLPTDLVHVSKLTSERSSGHNGNVKVKNIYRRPIIRTPNSPHSTTKDWTRPSTNEQRLRATYGSSITPVQPRSNNTNITGHAAQTDKICSDHANITGHGPQPDKVRFADNHRSITHCSSTSNLGPKHSHVEAHRAKSLPLLPNPILKRQGQLSVPNNYIPCKSPTRRACFKQQVDICYFDAKDRPQTTLSVYKDNRKISYGAYVISSDNELMAECGSKFPKGEQSKDNRIATPVIPPDGRDVFIPGQKDTEKGIACSTDVKFIPCVDGKGNKGRMLRLDVRANAKCVRERTLVKALSGGGAVIVHLFQNEAKDGGSAVLRQHVKKLPLPVNVDPYRVRAHVHKDGVLTIEAPVVDSSLPNIIH